MQGFRPLGLDLSKYVLEEARKATGVALVRADLFALPFADGTMDAVVAWQVVCHFDPGSRRAGLRELARVLAPGGILVASSCPSSAPVEASALPAGFEAIDLRGLDPTPDCPWQRWVLIPRKIARSQIV